MLVLMPDRHCLTSLDKMLAAHRFSSEATSTAATGIKSARCFPDTTIQQGAAMRTNPSNQDEDAEARAQPSPFEALSAISCLQ